MKINASLLQMYMYAEKVLQLGPALQIDMTFSI